MARSKKDAMTGMFSGMFTAEEPAPETKKAPQTKSAYELSKEEKAKARANSELIEVPTEVTHTEAKTFTLEYTETEKPEPKKFILTRSKEELKELKPEELKPKKKSERKAAFSVWLDTATASDLKQYVTITGNKMTDVLETAIHEYLQRHKITEEQKEAYRQRELERLNNL